MKSRPKAKFHRFSSRLATQQNFPIPHKATQRELLNFHNAGDRKRQKIDPRQQLNLLEINDRRSLVDQVSKRGPLPNVFQADLQYQTRSFHTKPSKSVKRPPKQTLRLPISRQFSTTQHFYTSLTTPQVDRRLDTSPSQGQNPYISPDLHGASDCHIISPQEPFAPPLTSTHPSLAHTTQLLSPDNKTGRSDQLGFDSQTSTTNSSQEPQQDLNYQRFQGPTSGSSVASSPSPSTTMYSSQHGNQGRSHATPSAINKRKTTKITSTKTKRHLSTTTLPAPFLSIRLMRLKHAERTFSMPLGQQLQSFSSFSSPMNLRGGKAAPSRAQTSSPLFNLPTIPSQDSIPWFHIDPNTLHRLSDPPKWLGGENNDSLMAVDVFEVDSMTLAFNSAIPQDHPGHHALYGSSIISSKSMQYDTLAQLRDSAEAAYFEQEEAEIKHKRLRRKLANSRQRAASGPPFRLLKGGAMLTPLSSPGNPIAATSFGTHSKKNHHNNPTTIATRSQGFSSIVTQSLSHGLLNSSSSSSSSKQLRANVQHNNQQSSPTFQSLSSPSSLNHHNNSNPALHHNSNNNQHYNYSSRSNTMMMNNNNHNLNNNNNNNTGIYKNVHRHFSSSNIKHSLIYHSSPYFATPRGFNPGGSQAQYAYQHQFYRRNTNYNYARPQTNLYDRLPASISTTTMSHLDHNNQIIRRDPLITSTTSKPLDSQKGFVGPNRHNPSHWNLIYFSQPVSPHHKYSADCTTVDQLSSSQLSPSRHYVTLHQTQPFSQSSFLSSYAPDKYSGNPKAKLHKAPRSHRFTLSMSRNDRIKQIEIDHENGNGWNNPLNSNGVGHILM